jgi:hypothetical protein
MSGAPVSGVKSLRLSRAHLIHHTGSWRPHRISVTSVWRPARSACTSTPRGGPQVKWSGPGCASAHETPQYKGARRFLCIAHAPTSSPILNLLRPVPPQFFMSPFAVELDYCCELSRNRASELARSSIPFFSGLEKHYGIPFLFSVRHRRSSPL